MCVCVRERGIIKLYSLVCLLAEVGRGGEKKERSVGNEVNRRRELACQHQTVGGLLSL